MLGELQASRESSRSGIYSLRNLAGQSCDITFAYSTACITWFYQDVELLDIRRAINIYVPLADRS